MDTEIEFYVIMDKKKKAIACGSPRNRSMRLVENLNTKKTRVLLYRSKKQAISAFSGGLGFYDETHDMPGNPSHTYIRSTYPHLHHYESICIPVKVKLVIEDEK